MGTYGYDRDFLAERGIRTVELSSADGMARVLMVPAWQGRVMTSTTGGRAAPGYGWINHGFIASGEFNPQFNSYGGEERFWIGPEGQNEVREAVRPPGKVSIQIADPAGK